MSNLDLMWNGLGALITLAIFSFLFKDNVVYKFVERLWVGVTTGYWTMLLFHTSFTDKVWVPLTQNFSTQWIYLFPVILGLLMWFRMSRKYGFLARYALAFYIGISTGVFIPLAIKTAILFQLQGTIRPIDGSLSGIMFAVAFIGVLCSLSYFFFSREHKGILGVSSKIGIYTLMIGFGAGFGLTVMGRIALLVQRVTFLRDYSVELFGSFL
jgi:hypothetical protein